MEQAKDLVSQTLARLYSPESYQSYQRRDDPIRNKVAEVIVTLGINYGYFFTEHHCKDDVMLEAVISVWAADIGSYSVEKLNRTIERCKELYPEKIILPQFNKCLRVTQEQAMNNSGYDGPLYLTKLETPEAKSKRIKTGEAAVSKMLAGLMTC